MLSLSRVLGGTLRGQETAHLIADVELDRLVRDLLRSVPEPVPSAGKKPAASVLMQASRHHLRTVGVFENGRLREEIIDGEPEIRPSELNLEPGIHIIAERAQSLTGATGAAIALRAGSEMVCRARTGRTWEFIFRQIPDFQLNACAPAKYSYATMPKPIRASILPAAAGSVHVRFWWLPSATAGILWASSKSCLPPRTRLINGMCRLCSCCRV